MSDYWGDDSVAIMYFLLCHHLQLTHCLFTCHASEYHQNSMLIDKYMLSFLLLLAHLLSLVWRHVWITIQFGSNLSVLLSPRHHQEQLSVWKCSGLCIPISQKESISRENDVLDGEYFTCTSCMGYSLLK